jgi:hypothetical protein
VRVELSSCEYYTWEMHRLFILLRFAIDVQNLQSFMTESCAPCSTRRHVDRRHQVTCITYRPVVKA